MPTNLFSFLNWFRTRARSASFVQHLIVLLACAAGLLSSQFLLPAAALILAAWLGRWLISRRTFTGRVPTGRVPTGRAIAATPADLGILLLMIMAGVSLLITPLPELTQPQVLRLFIGVATYYALAEAVANHAPAHTPAAWVVFVLMLLTLVGTALALIAPISVDWYANKGLIPAWVYSRFIVLLSDSVHPNVMGGTLALFIPFGLTFVLFLWPRLRIYTRILALLTTGLMLLILLLTQSRSAYTATIAAAVCLWLLRVAIDHPKRAGVIGALALVGMGIVLTRFVLQVPLLPSLNTAVTTTQGIDATINGRLEIWSRGIYMVQDFPFTGTGMGLHARLIETMYPYFINPVPLLHAHNLFLQIAVDLGLPGLVAWCATLIVITACAISLYRSGRHSQNRWQVGLGAGLIASLLALIVGGLTDAVTWGGIRTAPLVWIIWGVAVGSWMQVKAQDAERQDAEWQGD